MLSLRKSLELDEKTNPIAFISEVLLWKDFATLHSQIYASHFELLSTKFEQAVAAFVKAGVGSRLIRLAQTMSKDSFTRFITAPTAVRRLLYEPPTDLVFFLQSLQSEEYRLCETCDVSRAIWTALGDYYFPAGHLDTLQMQQNTAVLWNPERCFRAPHLSNGIPIDYASPFATETISDPSVSYTPLNQEEIRIMLEKLEMALRAVADISQEAYNFITLYVRVIVIRKDLAALNTFVSWSMDRYIGRIAFSNAQEETVDLAEMVDSLVHEAIHGFLYIIEEQYPLIDNRNTASQIHVQSPWSGRSLELHSFTHACLVWFGLWHFWKRALEQGKFPQERAQQLMERSRVGFHQISILDALDAASPYLSLSGQFILKLVEDVRQGVYY